MRVFVFTSPRYSHLVIPFALLFNRYWSANQEVVVSGVGENIHGLPGNFTVAPCEPYPASKWQHGVHGFLSSVDDEWFILMLEDYFLCRSVDIRGVNSMFTAARTITGTHRADLTTDVLHGYGDGRNAKELFSIGNYDIIAKYSDVPYRASLQAAIFNRKSFIAHLNGGNGSPWEYELYSSVQNNESAKVIGCRQWPVRYINAIDKGKTNWQQVNRLLPEDRAAIMPYMREITHD